MSMTEYDAEGMALAEQCRAQLVGHRRGRYRDFFRLADKLQGGDINFTQNPGDDSGGGRDALNSEKLIEEKPLAEGNSFSSRIRADRGGVPSQDGQLHIVAIDLDMDAALLPTSTPGHHHLVIDHTMTWPVYEELLIALHKAGLIQEGYLNASRKRKASWLRTPWTKK